MKRLRRSARQGFTIVELMIAISILSVILLLATTTMIAIGKLYYKGVNQARVQDSVRTISDSISSQLQLTGVDPQINSDNHLGVTVQALCIGEVRYTYVRDQTIGTSSGIIHGLWRDTNPNSAGCPLDATFVDNFLHSTDPPKDGAGIVSDGQELLPANSRLTALCVGAYKLTNPDPCTFVSSSPYTITVGIAYGDGAGGTFSGNGTATICSLANDQFCATSSLVTTVAKRIITTGTPSGPSPAPSPAPSPGGGD